MEPRLISRGELRGIEGALEPGYELQWSRG
jgi:hypothetical protein